MSDYHAKRYPLADITETPALPAEAEDRHDCPDLDLDQADTNAFITYRRPVLDPANGRYLAGKTLFTRDACDSCLVGALAEIHYGNPQPVQVRVAVLTAETVRSAA